MFIYNYKATLIACALSVIVLPFWILGVCNAGFLVSAILLTFGCWLMELLVSRSTLDELPKKD